MKVYLASSIFYEKDMMWNKYICKKIVERFPNIDLYSPILNEEINDKTKSAGAIQIAEGDLERLDSTDILIAVLDNDVIPSGTSAEIGYFSRMCIADSNKTIIGLYTDTRECSKTFSQEKIERLHEPGENQFSYANLFTLGLVKKFGILTLSSDEMIKKLGEYINE